MFKRSLITRWMQRVLCPAALMAAAALCAAYPATAISAEGGPDCVWDNLPHAERDVALENGMKLGPSAFDHTFTEDEVETVAQSCGYPEAKTKEFYKLYEGVLYAKLSEIWLYRNSNIDREQLELAWSNLDPKIKFALESETRSGEVSDDLRKRAGTAFLKSLNPQRDLDETATRKIVIYITGKALISIAYASG